MNTTHNVLELFESRVKESLPCLFGCFVFRLLFVLFFFFFSLFTNRKEEERYMAAKGEL